MELTQIPGPQNTKLELLDSFESAFSYFNAIQSSQKQSWINKLLPLASSYFFEKGDNNSFWFTDVEGQINSQFGKEIREKVPKLPMDLNSNQWLLRNGQYLISPSQFEDAKDHCYSWMNKVEYRQKFHRQGISALAGENAYYNPGGFSGPGSMSSALSGIGYSGMNSFSPWNFEEVETLIIFEVRWESVVSVDADFSDRKITGIKIVE